MMHENVVMSTSISVYTCIPTQNERPPPQIMMVPWHGAM
jgi:hypothetical protein